MPENRGLGLLSSVCPCDRCCNLRSSWATSQCAKMSMRLYAPPLPYGGWALSLTLLLQAFFWLLPEQQPKSKSRRCYRRSDSSRQDGQRWRDVEQEWEESDGSEDGEGRCPWGDFEGRDREEREPWVHASSSSAYQTDEEVRKQHNMVTVRLKMDELLTFVSVPGIYMVMYCCI